MKETQFFYLGGCIIGTLGLSVANIFIELTRGLNVALSLLCLSAFTLLMIYGRLVIRKTKQRSNK